MVVRAGRGAGLGVVDKLPSLKELIIAEAAGLTGDVPKLLRGEAV
jgi:2-octaprenyl-6-methoxyphenol hydroxylase